MKRLGANGGVNTRHARKLLRQEIRSAARELDGAARDDAAVHEARRHIKRARATLRLLRPALAASAYRREDRMLSRAAKPLGQLRDGRILIENLDALLPHDRGRAKIYGTGKLRQALRRALEQERRRLLTGKRGVRGSHRLLRKARRHARRWPTQRRDGAALLEGARRSYRGGRRALAAAAGTVSVAKLHALRKQAKYLAHQLRLLAPAKSSPLGQLGEEFHRLSAALGDDHDLAVLRGHVLAHPDSFPDRESQTRLVMLIEQRRTALEKQALLAAEALFRDRSRDFAATLRRACRGAARARRARSELPRSRGARLADRGAGRGGDAGR